MKKKEKKRSIKELLRREEQIKEINPKTKTKNRKQKKKPIKIKNEK